MDYDSLDTMRRTHPAWRLLAADHAALIASFLHRVFVQPNLRTIARQELVTRLEDQLFELRQQLGPEKFPKAAAVYLDDWAADDRGWLRKYYPVGSDEPHYDLMPATEKALDWLSALSERPFIGTESRLLTVFELLRQLLEGSELDPEIRIRDLEQRRAAIDAEIRQIRDGRLSIMDAVQVKERFLQMAGTARGLLSDFREVEQNFRNLDREVRERVATWEGGKGDLLEQVFGERDAIAESDQGRSFRAFWDFLMAPDRQEELSARLAAVLALAPVRELKPDPRLLRIHYDWLEAGEATQRTVARLSAQLRRYLDDQAWLENHRIMQLLRGIEQSALALRTDLPAGAFMDLDEGTADITMAFDRPLFSPPLPHRLDDTIQDTSDEDIPADALYDETYVDKTRLNANIRRMLNGRDQVTLTDLVDAHPLEQGLAELIAYLGIAADDADAMIDDSTTRTLRWVDREGRHRQATLPLVIFNQPRLEPDHAA